MKILIGGEIESELYGQFREIRNHILNELELLNWDIPNINELSFYIFLLKDFETIPKNKYIKKHQRVEIEVIILFDFFNNANETQRMEALKENIFNSISKYQNRNIEESTIDMIKNKMRIWYLGNISENIYPKGQK